MAERVPRKALSSRSERRVTCVGAIGWARARGPRPVGAHRLGRSLDAGGIKGKAEVIVRAGQDDAFAFNFLPRRRPRDVDGRADGVLRQAGQADLGSLRAASFWRRLMGKSPTLGSDPLGQIRNGADVAKLVNRESHIEAIFERFDQFHHVQGRQAQLIYQITFWRNNGASGVRLSQKRLISRRIRRT